LPIACQDVRDLQSSSAVDHAASPACCFCSLHHSGVRCLERRCGLRHCHRALDGQSEAFPPLDGGNNTCDPATAGVCMKCVSEDKRDELRNLPETSKAKTKANTARSNQGKRNPKGPKCPNSRFTKHLLDAAALNMTAVCCNADCCTWATVHLSCRCW